MSPHCDFQTVVQIEKVGSSGVQLSLVERRAFPKLFSALRDLFNTPIDEERYFFKLSDKHEVVVATLYNQRQVVLRKISANTSGVSSNLSGDVDMVFLAETSWHGLQNLLDCYMLQPIPAPRLDVYQLQHEVFAMTKKHIFHCVLTTLQLRLADKTMALSSDMDKQ